ncbi:MAG: Ig-like domain-containing protein [Pseudomonadales bacterium]|nr:Ig-like domain-containing protein [Pseudomonadales bacterium]
MYKKLLFIGVLYALWGCGGGSDGDPYEPPSLSEGVIFTYPIDGQTDVHLGTRFYVTFSQHASQSAVNTPCRINGSGKVSGNFCLVGPDNRLVAISPTVDGPVVKFETDQLQQGTRYSLYVRSAVIGGGETNLPSSDPLVTFLTSQYDPVNGQSPTITAINGEDPDVYSTTVPAPPAARYPMMDFNTIRVEFSEPLDEKTVQYGSSFEFVAVDGASETPVDGALVVRKQHVSFDPSDDLTPGQRYRLRLADSILDRNGEALASATYELTPIDANSCNCVITQRFNTTHAFGESGFPKRSRLTRANLNAIDLYSPIISNSNESLNINLTDTTLEAELADPSSFDGLIPFVIRKGAYLSITGLDLALGGEVPANLETGSIRASFINDVTGFMDRNPYRDAAIDPDDDKSPVFVYLIFDLALTGSDTAGNTVLNQTIPHVQATGTARIADGKIYIESVRTIVMDLLGLDRAPAHMVLGINSDLESEPINNTEAPILVASQPADNALDSPIRDEISLIFDQPMDNLGITAQDEIMLIDNDSGGAQVPFQLRWDGSTILLTPDDPLAFGHQYQITLSGLQDIQGNSLSFSPEDGTGGDGVLVFTTENPDLSTGVGPQVSAVHVGAPCTLTDSDLDFAGRCAGGNDADDRYLHYSMPADGRIEVTFNQPMDVSTLVLGAACDSGAVRVEALDSGGSCTGVVDGSLIVETHSFKFIPRHPLAVDSDYRLTLVAGGNTSCDAEEICGANGVPLNPDPLNGAQASDAGGGNTVSIFTATAVDEDVFLPLRLQSYTDMNGNGFVDAGETARTENSAEVSIIGIGGIVSAANFLDEPGGLVIPQASIYLSGGLPVTIGQPEPLTVDGSLWDMNLVGASQIPVEVHPGVLYGTSITMDSTATVLFIDIPIADVSTGMSVMRLRQSDGPISGYIVQEEGVDQPQFIAQLDLYMDAPDMAIEVDIPLLGGLIAVNHSLHSLPLTAVVKGPVTFLNDGRVRIEQSNVDAINLDIDLTSIAGNGSVSLQIGAGGMQLNVIGNPLKGRP